MFSSCGLYFVSSERRQTGGRQGRRQEGGSPVPPPPAGPPQPEPRPPWLEWLFPAANRPCPCAKHKRMWVGQCWMECKRRAPTHGQGGHTLSSKRSNTRGTALREPPRFGQMGAFRARRRVLVYLTFARMRITTSAYDVGGSVRDGLTVGTFASWSNFMCFLNGLVVASFARCVWFVT